MEATYNIIQFVGMEVLSYSSAPCCNAPFLKQLNHQGGFRSLNTSENFKHVDPILSSGSSDGYIIGEEEDESISETGEPVTKVLIPGLPDESKGELGAPVSRCFWEWKPKFNVHYEKAGCETLAAEWMIGVYYGTPQVTSEGIALKFFATFQLEIRSTGKIKSFLQDGSSV
ncbi:pheophytinase chloroplastic [Prunus yedoensis var. nudiflora]|uniref:Pheophytinase chloroplastic n=1 Tax=Prunus yedoensis var. nudiflora TaxID=2094558 RepID=A0A314Z028_PRUYE|nr:pheophytinase chloroplastic [Prunus yedoensis var. nudiflora]